MTTGSVLAQFTITLSQAVSEPVAVDWYTSDGTALAGVDYAANKGTATFAPGQTAKVVSILVYGRAVGSEDRSFFVEMLPPVNAILGASIGECIIHVDNTGSTPVTQIIVPTGPQGIDGDSAYQVWLDLGNTGTEQDFIDSLKPSAEEIAEEVAPLLNVGNSPVTAEGTEAFGKPDEMTVKRLARRVAYVGATKVATVALAAGDNLIGNSDLTGDTLDMSSAGLYPRIYRGTVFISPLWDVEPDGRILIKGAQAGDVLYVCQYDVASSARIRTNERELWRRYLAEIGITLVEGSFEDGAVANSNTEAVWHVGGAKCYGWGGIYPKNIPEDSNPGNTGGVSPSAWSVFERSLRGDLQQNSGSTLITHEGKTVASILSNLTRGIRVINVTPNTPADVTSLLQAEFNLAGAMYIPEGVYMVKAHTEDGGFAGVRPKNDSLIIFHPKAVFKAITNNQPAYAIINFQSVSNITVIEPSIVGDNDTHTGVTGEFGMGLYIRDSHNIHIHRPNISKCWGDGVYIGQVGSVGACTNVTLDEPVIDGCRRQGISIISADGLTINNPVITNIDGTPPSAGIDIEPNSPSCILNNIKINNLKTENTASGLTIDLAPFTDGVTTKTVDIEINGHSDEGSDFGATFTRNLHPTAGSIRYLGVTLKNNDNNGILYRRWHSKGAHIITDHPVVINPNRAGNGAVLNAAGIAGYTLSADASPTTGSGNITLINPRVIFEDGITPAFPAQISFRDTKSGNVDKVKILDMVDDPATFIETITEFNRSTCEVTTAFNTKYLGKETSVEQQNFGFMGKFSGSLVASGLTSKAVIALPPSSLWKPGLIRVAVTCCAITSGTPAANSIGYSEALIGYRHKNSAVPVGITKIDTVANANAVISVVYFDSPPRAEVTVTMLAAGNTVGWDVEAGGPAGYPLSVNLT